MTPGETFYDIAPRLYAEQQTRIGRQQALIAQLRKKGEPTSNAEALLRLMLSVLACMKGEITPFGEYEQVSRG